MTIYEKLAKARTMFAEERVGKTGINTHAEFKYFELEDIVPVARKIFDELKCLFLISFPDNIAKGELIDLEKPESRITVQFDMKSIAEPAKFRMNEVQALGAETTYMRRYLYFILLDITEPDAFDASSGKPEPKPAEKKKPATKEERKVIKEELTNTDGPATEMQILALKNACVALMEKDPSMEDFVQEIAVRTESFTKLTKAQCEELVNSINSLIGG